MVNVVITVPNDKVFASVVEKATEAGLQIESAHDKLGLITGSIEVEKIELLAQIEGVGFVREEKGIKGV